jgi:cold shock CspA family protein/ribosome-associated translation inhibitor RaiA
MDIPLKIMVQDIEHSAAVDSLIRKKVEHLSHYFPHIVGCRVAVDLPQKHTHQGKLYNVRIEITVPGKEIVVVRDEDQDVNVALRDAFDAARRQLEDWARKERGATKLHEPLFYGTIVRYFSEEGFGFIESEEGREVYFNRDNCVHPAFEELDIGRQVQFLVVEGSEGPQAKRVTERSAHST